MSVGVSGPLMERLTLVSYYTQTQGKALRLDINFHKWRTGKDPRKRQAIQWDS